jgi:chloride channel 7
LSPLLPASTIALALQHAGVITAAAAFAVNLGVENISGFKFWATLTLLERGQPVASFLVYALVNCTLIGVSVYITVNYAPAAAGSGIAEVKVSGHYLLAQCPFLCMAACMVFVQ